MSDENNIFQPPRSNVVEAEPTYALNRAGKGRRFGTFVVDYLCFLAFSMLIGVSIALLFGEAGIAAIESIPDIVLGSTILIVFYVFFEGLWGRTPGKFLFGTVVVNEEGEKATFGQVVARTLCRFIPFEVFSFLGERGWHDSISRTQVVLVRGS
jgi:uncharacterized RDD family membrane protein YckC